MADNTPILVTGAAGQLGAVGRTVCGLLLDRGLPVRAMVRREDDRAAALRAVGAEVVVGDLLEPADVYRVVSGCRRVYFGMSVSAGYLEATVTMAVVAREVGVDAVVNMSQMTVSQMSIQNTTSSGQQRQHWLGEHALAWSGLPVVTIRPTIFLESFFPLAGPTVRARGRIEVPFGRARPLRLRRLMSPGWSLPFSPTPGRIWAGYTNSPVRGHKTCTGSPGSSRTRSTVRSRTSTSPPRIGHAGSRRWGCRNTSPGIW